MRLLHKTWISYENSIAQNILGVVLAIPVILISVIIILFITPFSRPTKRSASEVETYLTDFLEDKGNAFAWDDFISARIVDPELEAIRQRAANIELPLDKAGSLIIQHLLLELEGLQPKPTDSA